MSRYIYTGSEGCLRWPPPQHSLGGPHGQNPRLRFRLRLGLDVELGVQLSEGRDLGFRVRVRARVKVRVKVRVRVKSGCRAGGQLSEGPPWTKPTRSHPRRHIYSTLPHKNILLPQGDNDLLVRTTIPLLHNQDNLVKGNKSQVTTKVVEVLLLLPHLTK
jgi:hypothetical protein